MDEDSEAYRQALRVVVDLKDRRVKGSHFDILIYAAYIVSNESEFEYILKAMPKEARKIGRLAIDYLTNEISKIKTEH